MMYEGKTCIAIPPGETIKELICDRGMSQRELARRMDYSEKFVSQLVNGKVELTPRTALRLEMVLGAPASFWSNLEVTYRGKLARVEEEKALQDDVELSTRFPYAEMAKLGWVPATRKPEERALELRKFFEVARLGVIDSGQGIDPAIACRRQKETDASTYAVKAWSQRARIEARDIQTRRIDLKKLEASLRPIRSMTVEDPSVFQPSLVELLADCGVAFVILPHVRGSCLQGATFRDGSKIVLGLTLRRRCSDTFWFSLFHELGHILLGHTEQPDGTSDEDEASADNFASSQLIPDDAYDDIVAGDLSSRSIVKWSEELEIAPGIIVGRLQKDGLIPYNRMNNLKVEYRFAG